MPEAVLYIIALVLSIYGLASLLRRLVMMFISCCDHTRTAVIVRPRGIDTELQLRGAVQLAEEQGVAVVVLCDRLDDEGAKVCRMFGQTHENIVLCDGINQLQEYIFMQM
ncbi:MAG: hypothetical protein PUB05_02480 [Firmicutes bacterium]|nr:hypothetical protein [Bacillota bacterium]